MHACAASNNSSENKDDLQFNLDDEPQPSTSSDTNTKKRKRSKSNTSADFEPSPENEPSSAFEPSSDEDNDMAGLEKAKYVPNARGGLCVLYDGFLFTKDKPWTKFRTVTTTVTELVEGEEVTRKVKKRRPEKVGMIWRCNQHKKKSCRARIKVSNNDFVFAKKKLCHRHWANPHEAAVNQVIYIC